MKRKKEILERMAEIRAKLESNDPLTDEQIDALDNEKRNLEAELAGIERRSQIAAGINAGTVETRTPAVNPVLGTVGTPGVETPPAAPEERSFARDTVLATPEYRSAFGKKLMGRSLTPVEQRALDTALTTTDTTFTAPSADADGVNNGGLFIPEGMNLELLEQISLVSPIFRDIKKTNVPGVVKFPYKKTASKAKSVKEKDKTPDLSIEWGLLTLDISEIAETIPVTWRLEAMSVDGFLEYLMGELKELVEEQLVTNAIYGTGSDEMSGVTKDAIDNEYTGTALDSFKAGLGLLSAKLKVKAKIYVAADIVEEIAFSKDDNGQYIYSPINSGGVNSVATYPVEVDPYLKPGDYIIGNVTRRMKMNVSEAFSITRDVSGKKRVNEYTAFGLVAGAAQPNTLVYGHKKTA